MADSFSLEGQEERSNVLGRRGEDERYSGLTHCPSIIFLNPYRDVDLTISRIEPPTIFPPGSRHPRIEIPLENPIVLPEETYYSPLSRQEYDRRMDIMGEWLTRNQIATSALVNTTKRLQLIPSALEMMKENLEDKGILVYAYMLSDEIHHDRLGKFLHFEQPEVCKRYSDSQKAWWAVGVGMFREKYGKWPNELERFNIMYNQIRLPFRAFFVLKEEALKELGQKVEYSWGKEAMRYVHEQCECSHSH